MQKTPPPSIPKTILIVGGGTAGWMAASILLHAWRDYGVIITLIESADIGIIGVGEGSTPALRNFFSYLRIAEQEWMPACDATYKAGIYFDNWSNAPGFESYFHPFYSAWDLEGAHQFVNNVNQRRAGMPEQAHPNNYFLSYFLAEANKAPLPLDTQLGNQVSYGYHFDSHLLGKFLRDRACRSGLTHIVDTVTDVQKDSDGDIAAIHTQKHGPLNADFYLDCTGFAGLLLNKALDEPIIPFKENLFNDSAVTIQTSIDNAISPATRSVALGYGWAWKIPLVQRYGNGYVYSSDFISADQAEQELRKHLGHSAEDKSARHLKMRVGRVEKHWKKNCLAVGLAQGFIEPLEATALAIVQSTVETFVDSFDKPITEQTKINFNEYINSLIEGIRDYIVTHYFLNNRTDTSYWRACREEAKPSASLQTLIDAWDNNENFLNMLFHQDRSKVYKPESWYCIFAGMGRFKNTVTAPDTSSKNLALKIQLTNLTSTYFEDHRQRLQR